MVSFYYREYTVGVSGLVSLDSQKERLARAIGHYRKLDLSRRDLILLGYFNLDFHHWANTGYNLKELVEMEKHLQGWFPMAQVVDKPTRFATSGSTVVRSLLLNTTCCNCGGQ